MSSFGSSILSRAFPARRPRYVQPVDEPLVLAPPVVDTSATPRWHAPMVDPAPNLDVLARVGAQPVAAAPVEVLAEPMRRANINQADQMIESGLTPAPQPAPVMRRAAQYDQALDPAMPEVTPLRDHSTDAPRGFWGKLGHFGEHFAKTFAATPGNLIEKLSAGVVGGARPDIADRIVRENIEKPRVYAERARIGKEADNQQARVYRAKQMQNLDLDNERAAAAEIRAQETQKRLGLQHDQDLEFKREQAAALREMRHAQTQQQKDAALDRLVDTYGAYGQPVPPALVKGTPYERLGGIAKPARDPNALTPYQQYQMGRDVSQDARTQGKDRQSLVREARTVMTQFEGAKRKATEMAAKATAIKTALDNPILADDGKTPIAVYKNKIVSQSDLEEASQALEAARAEMGGFASQLSEGYGDVVEVGKDYVKLKAAPRSSAPPRSTGGPQTGQIMTTKDGRRIRVKKIENGQVTDYDLLP